MVKSMNELLMELRGEADSKWILKHTKAFMEIERGQTFKNYAESASYVYNLLNEEGFSVEKLSDR